MGRLTYTILMSLDGFIEGPDGGFDWAAPDEEVHQFVNDLERASGTHLYGRRMYEVMRAWETLDREPDQPAAILDYARIWRSADKIVFSSALADADVSTSRTRLERTFDPTAIAELKRAARSDLSIGGPNLASVAFRAGLIDVVRLFVAPIVVGGGKPALPRDVTIPLELQRTCGFGNGMVFVEYEVRYAGAEEPEEAR